MVYLDGKNQVSLLNRGAAGRGLRLTGIRSARSVMDGSVARLRSVTIGVPLRRRCHSRTPLARPFRPGVKFHDLPAVRPVHWRRAVRGLRAFVQAGRELPGPGDRKAVPLPFSFLPGNRNSQRNRLPWTLPAARGTRNSGARLRAMVPGGDHAAGAARAGGDGRDRRPGTAGRSWTWSPGRRRSRYGGARGAAPRRPRSRTGSPPRRGTCALGTGRSCCDGRRPAGLLQPGCDRKTFTESLPAVPARARLTARLRTRLGECVGDDLMPAAAAARRYGVSDRTAARAFTSYASGQLADLDAGQEPVQAAGIDEFRRGAPASAAAADTARSPRPGLSGSPTSWTWEAAAASAWPRAVPPKRRKTC